MTVLANLDFFVNPDTHEVVRVEPYEPEFEDEVIERFADGNSIVTLEDGRTYVQYDDSQEGDLEHFAYSLRR